MSAIQASNMIHLYIVVLAFPFPYPTALLAATIDLCVPTWNFAEPSFFLSQQTIGIAISTDPHNTV